MGPVARLLRWRRVCVNARNTRTNTHTHTLGNWLGLTGLFYRVFPRLRRGP